MTSAAVEKGLLQLKHEGGFQSLSKKKRKGELVGLRRGTKGFCGEEENNAN